MIRIEIEITKKNVKLYFLGEEREKKRKKNSPVTNHRTSIDMHYTKRKIM